MYGHPRYGIGWRAIMLAQQRRQRRRLALTAAGVVALLVPVAHGVGRLLGML